MIEYFDTLNSFILEFKENLTQYDIDNFINTEHFFLENSGDFLTSKITPFKCIPYLDRMNENLQSISNETQKFINFYSNVYKSLTLSDAGISIPVAQMEDISKIRPDYLLNIATEFDMKVRDIITKRVDSDTFMKDYTSENYYYKLKKQLVKTTVSHNDIRDLMVFDSPTIVKIDNLYVQNVIIPFLRSYDQSIKDISVLVMSTKAKINQSYNDLTNNFNAIKTINKSLDIKTKEKIMLLYYNMYRAYLNACAYITAMIIRKSHYYAYNMMAYANLYNTIHDYFPDGEDILHESVIDADLKDIDDADLLISALHDNMNAILPYIHKNIGKAKMIIANIMTRKYNRPMNYLDDESFGEYQYDTAPYVALNKTIINIIKSLNMFEKFISSPDIIIDDILTRCEFDKTFVKTYENILTNIPNIEFYTVQMNSNLNNTGDVLLSVYNDISNFEKNITVISSNIYRVNKHLEELNDSLEINTVGYDNAYHSELTSVINTTIGNFKDYALEITKKLIERLNNLTDILDDTDIVDIDSFNDVTPYNYSFDSFQEAFSELEMQEKNIFEKLLTEYHMEKMKKDTGINLLVEDVTPAQDGQTSSEVKTDAPEQHANNEGPSTNSTNSDNSQNNKSSGSKISIQKFIQFFKDLLEKFRGKSSKLTKTNDKWLASVKASILGLNTDKTTITIAKYEGTDEDSLNTAINGAINKINTVNVNSLPKELDGSGGRKKAETYLFPNIPSKIGNETSFPALIKQFLIYGNSEKPQLVSYSGNDAKTVIQNMITYCENYSKFSSSISTKLDSLSKAAANEQEDIINSLGDKPKATNEASENTVTQNGSAVGQSKDDKSKTNASTLITGVARDYSAAVLTVIEKKYLDYIKVLNKLSPARQDKPTTKEEPKEESNKPQEDTNQPTENNE